MLTVIRHGTGVSLALEKREIQFEKRENIFGCLNTMQPAASGQRE